MKPLVTVVLPIFNEEKNIPVVYEKVSTTLQKLSDKYAYEFVMVNDGSRDKSWELIKELGKQDNRVKGVSFSRNFGHQAALSAGYQCAHGDAIISMDADLQDSPEILTDMLNKWADGADIVYARRLNRKDPWLKKVTAHYYYRILDSISDVRIPRNVGDFRLIDKKVLQQINGCKEKSRYLRGMVAWVGFKQDFVDFNRAERVAGTSGYTWKKMFKLAFDGLTGFSTFPLKLAAYVGTLVIISGTCMFGYITVNALFYQAEYPLFKWLVTIIYIFMGVQFLLLWLLGEYIGRIYEQQKDRPLYIVAEKVNADPSTSCTSCIPAQDGRSKKT